MKKLYSCNARITDNFDLISYSTPVVEFFTRDNWAGVRIYRASMTTQSHIRKFAQWLNENGKYHAADLVQRAYNASLRTHSAFGFAANNGYTFEVLEQGTDKDCTIADWMAKVC